MDILPLLCIVSVAFTGLTKGAGVLPDGPLNAAVGETVMFTTTLTPPEKTLSIVTWIFGDKGITSFNVVNTTEPEYKGRITLFLSTGSLELRNLALTDSGEYRVIIHLQGGTVNEGNTRLDVYERVSNVEVTTSNTDLVEFNSSVRLSCASFGSSLSFLWLNSSSEVTASDRVQFTDGDTNLTIVNVTRYDQGPFMCRVFNLVSNCTSDPVNLSISYGPENIILTLSPSKEYYEIGSDIRLNCSAVSRPSALFYWFLNEDLQSHTGPEISLMNIQMNQSGNYSCQAFNNKTLRYETSQQSVVSVLERISNASVIPSNLPIEGNSVNLTCDAAGFVFTRKWMKDGSDLIPDDNIMLHDENRVLSFTSLNKKHSGEYSCKISNPINNEEAKYTLIVNYGPENVQITAPNEIEEKQTLTLTCSAESTPSATYTWILNGTEIHNSAVFTKDITEPSDSGNYTCEARNSITGRISPAYHQLSVTAYPDKTSSCSAGCIAGIVIACVVIFLAAVGGGYYICKKKKQPKTPSNRTTTTRTGGEGQDNTANSRTQEENYADVRFFQNKNGKSVNWSQDNSSEYAQVQVNSSRPAPSSPSTYDAYVQRTKGPAPQPGANGAQVYTRNT